MNTHEHIEIEATACTINEAHEAGHDLAEAIPSWLVPFVSVEEVSAGARRWAAMTRLSDVNAAVLVFAAATRASERGCRDALADAAVGLSVAEARSLREAGQQR